MLEHENPQKGGKTDGFVSSPGLGVIPRAAGTRTSSLQAPRSSDNVFVLGDAIQYSRREEDVPFGIRIVSHILLDLPPRIRFRSQRLGANLTFHQELSEFLETGADELAATIYRALVSGSCPTESEAEAVPPAAETVSSRKRKMSVDGEETPVKMSKAEDGQAIPTFGGEVSIRDGQDRFRGTDQRRVRG